MFKIQIAPDRVYDLVNTANATMHETLKIKQTGYTITDWDAGYARLNELILQPEKELTTIDLFNDNEFLVSISISVWIARLRAGEVISFDDSTKDWSFADFKLIPPEISEFAKKKSEDSGESDPSKPEQTHKGSAPARKPRATKLNGNGQTI